MNYRKVYRAIDFGQKLPRKIKKKMLGRKLNKRQLKALVESVIITTNKYHEPKIHPFPFCPKCGCQETRFIDHRVEYPEVWVEDRCLRCDSWVGGADNSPYTHILEIMHEES